MCCLSFTISIVLRNLMQWSTMNSVCTHFAGLARTVLCFTMDVFVVICKKRNHANVGASTDEKLCRIA